MLKIRVLGKGLVPRIGALAPIKEPFYADYRACADIMRARGLTVEYFNPDTNKFAKLTPENIKAVSDKYYDKEWDQSVQEANEETPSDESEGPTGPQEGGGPGNPPPPPSVEPDHYGRYTKTEWEQMYDERTREHYKYITTGTAKWEAGMKTVYPRNNLVQVYICTEGHKSGVKFETNKWRVPNSAEEAKLDWIKGTKPSSISQAEYDGTKADYQKDDEVVWFNKTEGTWDVYKSNDNNPTAGSLNQDTKEGWTKLSQYYTDGTPKR